MAGGSSVELQLGDWGSSDPNWQRHSIGFSWMMGVEKAGASPPASGSGTALREGPEGCHGEELGSVGGRMSG